MYGSEVLNKQKVVPPSSSLSLPLSPPHLVHIPTGNKKDQFPSTEGAYWTVYEVHDYVVLTKHGY